MNTLEVELMGILIALLLIFLSMPSTGRIANQLSSVEIHLRRIANKLEKQ